MKCKDCQHYKESCELKPSEMEDKTCLLRHVCWLMFEFVYPDDNEDEDRDTADWWKNK